MSTGNKNYNIATQTNQLKILENIGTPSQESTVKQVLDNIGDFSSTDTLKQAIVSLATEIDNIKTSLSGGYIDEKLDNIVNLSQDNPIIFFSSDGDTVFKTISKTISSPNSLTYPQDIGSFTPAYSGTVTLNFAGSYKTQYANTKKILVSVNDTNYTIASQSSDTSGTFSINKNIIINVVAGQLYELAFESTSNINDTISLVVNIKGSKIINNGVV